MEHSKNFNKIKNYYDKKLWDKHRVYNMVEKKQITAEEYYPGFSRAIYLKGYRYNMHYCPKTLLVEVGAQTKTVQEAMNAMEPLADIIAKVVGEE